MDWEISTQKIAFLIHNIQDGIWNTSYKIQVQNGLS